MKVTNLLDEVLVYDHKEILAQGLYIPKKYLDDNKLNSSRKILLAALLHIEKNYGNKIIQMSYINKLTGVNYSTIAKELKHLEDLGYIVSEIVFNNDIAIGKRFCLKIKP